MCEVGKQALNNHPVQCTQTEGLIFSCIVICILNTTQTHAHRLTLEGHQVGSKSSSGVWDTQVSAGRKE